MLLFRYCCNYSLFFSFPRFYIEKGFYNRGRFLYHISRISIVRLQVNLFMQGLQFGGVSYFHSLHQMPSSSGQPAHGKKIGHRGVDASGETTYKKVHCAYSISATFSRFDSIQIILVTSKDAQNSGTISANILLLIFFCVIF